VDTIHFMLPRRFRNPDFHRHNLTRGYTQSNVIPLLLLPPASRTPTETEIDDISHHPAC
jgi:hypothetical protein